MFDIITANPLLDIAVALLIVQGLMGGFDTFYHHEIRIALPQKRSARVELMIHGIRAVLYGLLFFAIAHFAFLGGWIIAIALLIVIEVLLTLWDFVVEDGSRKLPPTERVLHTLLAINGGAIFGFYGVVLANWAQFDTAIIKIDLGWQGWILTLFALGVFLSGVRDLLASVRWQSKPLTDNPFLDLPHSRIFVTGATGFIGAKLVNQLLTAKHQVTVLSRNPLNAAFVFQSKARAIRSINELDHNEIFDVVINLAGKPIVGLPWSEKQKQRLLASRVSLTETIVSWFKLAKTPPKLWIQASAIGYYGVRPADEILTEDSHSDNSFMSELCQRWEAAAKPIESLGTALTIFRLGLVFGYGGALPQLLMPYRFGFGGKIGSGEQIMSWVHREDVISAFHYVMKDHRIEKADTHFSTLSQSKLIGTFNLVAPQTLSQAEFAHIVGKWLRRPLLLNLPEGLLRKAGGEMASLFVDGQNVSSQKLVDTGFEFRYPTVESVLKSL